MLENRDFFRETLGLLWFSFPSSWMVFTTHFEPTEEIQENNLENLTYQEVAHALCLKVTRTRGSGWMPALRGHTWDTRDTSLQMSPSVCSVDPTEGAGQDFLPEERLPRRKRHTPLGEKLKAKLRMVSQGKHNRIWTQSDGPSENTVKNPQKCPIDRDNFGYQSHPEGSNPRLN